MSSLTTTVNSLSGNLTSLSGSLATTNANLATTNANLSSLSGVVSSISSNVSTLSGQVAALQAQAHAAVTLGTANGLSLVGQQLSLALASTTITGALSATDWNVFNSKQANIATGTTLQYYRGDKTFQTLNTSVVPELTNLYFTNARAIAAPLTGFVA
jgi:ABC-type transporter Mla subunit MlaD